MFNFLIIYICVNIEYKTRSQTTVIEFFGIPITNFWQLTASVPSTVQSAMILNTFFMFLVY